MRRTSLILILAVLLTASALTGTTFARWMLSHQAVRGFEVSFAELCPGPDPTSFDVRIRFDNDSETETDVRNIALLLDFEGDLIASTTHRPEDGLIQPGDTIDVTVSLSSGFPAHRLPDVEECIEEDDAWSVRIETYLRHPIRDDTFTVRRVRVLGEYGDGEVE